ETARFCTVPSSRILTTRTSRYTIGYTASSGLFCQARTSSSTASVTLEMRVGLTSTPYISSRCPWMSRVVMPRAYIDRILPSKPAMRVWPFGMIWGSNVASRSRGVMTSISPNSPFKVFLLFPLRPFHQPLGQLPQQTVLAGQILRLPVVCQQAVDYFLFNCHWFSKSVGEPAITQSVLYPRRPARQKVSCARNPTSSECPGSRPRPATENALAIADNND